MQERIKRGLNLLLAAILIGISYNLFVLPNKLISPGINGLAALMNYSINFPIIVYLLVGNILFYIISLVAFGFKKSNKYLISCFLVPLAIFFTRNIPDLIKLDKMEMLLIVICASVIMGYANSIIYKEGHSVGGFYIIEDIINSISKRKRKIISLLCDLMVVVCSFLFIPIENSIYSLFLIFIVRRMTSKARFGISTSKTFYIISKKENEIKKYIMEDLKHDITILEAKGGFTKKENNIILTVVDTKDYYNLKEGIKEIDPNAFISVTDSYEVLNKNKKIKKKKSNII